MTTKNLWGELPEFKIPRTPENLLKEQAAELSRMTNGLLIGVIVASRGSYAFNYTFYIKAPSLNNYAVTILTISYDIGIYPIEVVKTVGSGSWARICSDEPDFESVISEILTSTEVRSLISSLLAHSHSLAQSSEAQ